MTNEINIDLLKSIINKHLNYLNEVDKSNKSKIVKIDKFDEYSKLYFGAIYRMPSSYKIYNLSLNTANLFTSDKYSITWNLSDVLIGEDIVKTTGIIKI